MTDEQQIKFLMPYYGGDYRFGLPQMENNTYIYLNQTQTIMSGLSLMLRPEPSKVLIVMVSPKKTKKN